MPGVDLSLASSYLPAIVCLAVSLGMACIVPYVPTPVWGYGLLLDRLLFNKMEVFDVNAVVAWTSALIALHADTSAVLPATLAMPISGVWAAVSMCQTARLSKLGFTGELLASLVMACALGCTHTPPESLSYSLARVAASTLATVTLLYTRAHDPDPLSITLLRTAPIILAPLPVSVTLTLAITGAVVWVSRQALAPSQPESTDSEAQLFQQALASRKATHSA